MKKNIPILWLFSGLFLGLVLALYSLLDTQAVDLPEGTVARVNDRFISQADYARALAAVVSDSEAALSDSRRRHILNRLIDEELLLQYGMDQGLVRSDGRVRASLVSAVLAAKSAAAETEVIGDEAARAFYTEHRDYFSRPQQLRVTLLQISDSQQAEAVRQAWQAGASIRALRADYAIQVAAHVPDALLPLGKLRQLIGASLTQAAMTLQPGEISPLIEIDDAAWLLRVEQRIDGSPAFEQVIDQVKAEMRRRGAETAVREALNQLREEHQVVIDEDRL